jgi:hypothetical protein
MNIYGIKKIKVGRIRTKGVYLDYGKSNSDPIKSKFYKHVHGLNLSFAIKNDALSYVENIIQHGSYLKARDLFDTYLQRTN